MTPVLSAFECAGIQSYVFASNRLQENLGASQLVREALATDLMQNLPAGSLLNWEERGPKWADEASRPEVLYVGGGNAVIRFPSLEAALEVTQKWSRDLLNKAPGLRPVAAHVPHATGNGRGLGETLEQAFSELNRVKRRPPSGWKLECLPITRRCASTGLAATKFVQYEGEEPE